jgi:hypothetical protein
MAKVGNISFKLVCIEIARQEGKAKRQHIARNRGFYTSEFQERAAVERKERLASYMEKNGMLPSFQSERKDYLPGIAPMGFETAVQYSENPTKVEARKPWRPKG